MLVSFCRSKELVEVSYKDITVMAYELRELASVLSKPGAIREEELLKSSLAKVINFDNLGYDVSHLLPSIIKFIPSHDILIKKLACNLLSRCSRKLPSIGLLVQNSLIQDYADANPFVRSLALKTLCTLEQPVENLIQILEKALTDSSSHVRRVAALCCARLHAETDSQFTSSDFVTYLYKLLRDPDPMVSFNSLVCLDEILTNEGGITLTKNTAHLLLNKLRTYTDLNAAHVMVTLLRYVPSSAEETFDILNVLDQFLSSQSVSVLCAATKLFIHLLADEPQLRRDVVTRVVPQLADMISSCCPEVQQGILEHLLTDLIPEYIPVISKFYRVFFCKFCDTSQLKIMKITILGAVIEESNVNVILDEMSAYSMDSEVEISEAAIRQLGLTAKRMPDLIIRKKCLDKLLLLFAVDNGAVLSEVLCVLQGLDVPSAEVLLEMKTRLPHCFRLRLNEAGKCSLFHLLETLGKDLPLALYLIEEFIHKELKDERSVAVKQCLITCCVKLFLHRPAECQDILGNLFELCWHDDLLLRDQVDFYYNCLRKSVQFAQQIIL